MRSNNIANQANIIAEQGKDIAEKSLFVSMRPYISIEPAKLDTKDSYIFIEKMSGGLKFNLRFKAMNWGQSIARDLKPTDIKLTIEKHYPLNESVVFSVIKTTAVKTLGNQSLAPGQSTHLDFSGEVKIENNDLINEVFKQIEQNIFELPINIEITYGTIFDPRFTGKTGVSVILKPQDFVINYTAMD